MARKEHPQSRGMRKNVAAKLTAAPSKTPIVIKSRKEIGSAKRAGKPPVRKMSLNQWIAVPDAPVQRNTEEHWNEPKTKKRLSVLREAHRTVHMAVTDDGEEFKLDGHTRTYGWVNNLTDAVPDDLTVVVHYVKNVEAVIEEYYTFDDAGQAKDAADQLYSALKQFNIQCRSKFLTRCKGIVAALKEALWEAGKLYEIEGVPANIRQVSVATCVQFFQDQLRALDKIDPTYKRFSGPPTSAFLLAHFKYSELGKHVDDVVEFFRRHQNDEGVKTGRTHDAVYAMSEILREKSGGGAEHRFKRLSRILGCVERFVSPGGKTGSWKNKAQVDMENYLIDEHALTTKNGAAVRHSGGKRDGRKGLTR